MKKKPTIAEGIAGESYTALKDHFNGLQPAVSVPAFLHNKIWMIARKKLRQRKRSWQKVKDSQVRMIWLCSNAACKPSIVLPDFYQQNGTPVCECGDDMKYSHTEVKVS
jgi:hypothetical protein